jgi:hypothetical protein
MRACMRACMRVRACLGDAEDSRNRSGAFRGDTSTPRADAGAAAAPRGDGDGAARGEGDGDGLSERPLLGLPLTLTAAAGVGAARGDGDGRLRKSRGREAAAAEEAERRVEHSPLKEASAVASAALSAAESGESWAARTSRAATRVACATHGHERRPALDACRCTKLDTVARCCSMLQPDVPCCTLRCYVATWHPPGAISRNRRRSPKHSSTSDAYLFIAHHYSPSVAHRNRRAPLRLPRMASHDEPAVSSGPFTDRV